MNIERTWRSDSRREESAVFQVHMNAAVNKLVQIDSFDITIHHTCGICHIYHFPLCKFHISKF